MSEGVTPIAMATLRFKLWNETTEEVFMDETFEMPEGMAILTIKKLYQMAASLPAEHSLNVFKAPGTKDLILDLTLKRCRADQDLPGQFESLFRWATPPELPGVEAQTEVDDVPAAGA